MAERFDDINKLLRQILHSSPSWRAKHLKEVSVKLYDTKGQLVGDTVVKMIDDKLPEIIVYEPDGIGMYFRHDCMEIYRQITPDLIAEVWTINRPRPKL